MKAVGGIPTIIQGGMGVTVSSWTLARSVSIRGQLGVVSGTALDTVLVRRLQDGDRGGHVRRAMADFPVRDVAAAALERFFLAGGRAPDQPYKLLPPYRQRVRRERQQLTMLATFVEVALAKEEHQGVVGLNLFAQAQMPTLASLYGAMLAGVDYILMSAGVPREIAGALDALSQHQRASLHFDVEGDWGEVLHLTFDPAEMGADTGATLKRPAFLPIISANSLATDFTYQGSESVEGLIVYGETDAADLARLRDLNLPFWLAGGAGSPARLAGALAAGATGIQVGRLFAFCKESGLADYLKRDVLDRAVRGDDLVAISTFLGERTEYTANDVINYLLGTTTERLLLPGRERYNAVPY
jgi:nitronate monooxygenase